MLINKEIPQDSTPNKKTFGGRGGKGAFWKSLFVTGVYMRFFGLCTITCAIILVSAGVVFAVEYGVYGARVVFVYDGDTFTADVDVWPGQVNRVHVRIVGIDAPEIRTRNACEKALAIKARDAMRGILARGKVTLTQIRLGKYAGRMLATVLVDGADAGAEMIRRGLARVYHGGKRLPWCGG